MAILILYLLLWIPSLVGWGKFLNTPRPGKSPTSPLPEAFVDPIIGMATLTAVTNILNFISPITELISAIVLIIGWLRFSIHGRKWPRLIYSKRAICLGLLWILVVAFWCSRPIQNYDTGLYHLQSIKWMRESMLPYGLANLYAPLGYNSSWYFLGATLQIPIIGSQRTVSYLLSALIITVFGLAVGNALHDLRRSRDYPLHVLFMASGVFTAASYNLPSNLGSATADLPIFLLTLLISAWTIRLLESLGNWGDGLFVLAILTWFCFTIKISSAPLLLIPLSAAFFARRHRLPRYFRIRKPIHSAYVILLVIPWLLRGASLSGCMGFPIASSCLPRLAWSVTSEHAAEVSRLLRLRSRIPVLGSELAASMLGWVWPWLVRHLLFPGILNAIILAIVGLGLYMLFRSGSGSNGGDLELLAWLIVPLLGAAIAWFVISPDIRFGEGYFYAIAFCLLAVGARAALKSGVPAIGDLPKCSVAGILSCILIIRFFFVPLGALLKDPLHMLLELPPIPEVETVVTRTAGGAEVFVPLQGEQCWLAELPCTPDLDPNLAALKREDGTIVMFYLK